VAPVFASPALLRLLRTHKAHSASAPRATATTGPTTAPAIKPVSSVVEGWLLDEVCVAVGAMLDDPLEPGETTVDDVVEDAVLVVVLSEIVKVDVAVRISDRLWETVCAQSYL
jgi:hypothetical protein